MNKQNKTSNGQRPTPLCSSAVLDLAALLMHTFILDRLLSATERIEAGKASPDDYAFFAAFWTHGSGTKIPRRYASFVRRRIETWRSLSRIPTRRLSAALKSLPARIRQSNPRPSRNNQMVAAKSTRALHVQKGVELKLVSVSAPPVLGAQRKNQGVNRSYRVARSNDQKLSHAAGDSRQPETRSENCKA